jgi:TetR/AcrR family transcriptional repressor of mexJK operon
VRAAREAFMQDGYHANMDGIAARAGVAKQTLYNHFPGKNELFSEVAGLSSEAIAVTLESADEELRAVLLRFAKTFRERVLGEEGLAVFRALTAEAVRFPELAQAFFAKGSERTAQRLAELLGRGMGDGRLRQDDPHFAAEMLMSMLGGVEHFRRLCAAPAPEVDEDARVARIVDTFLRAYAPNKKMRNQA